MLEVIVPGLLSTVQDGGRPEAAPLGVPRSGACDPLALAAANLLLGNDPDAAVLECSLLGPELAVLERCAVAIAGADFDVFVPEARLTVRPGTSLVLEAGWTLGFGASLDGARACLALAGGIDVPLVLGSRSTCLVAGFGGLDGSALRAGDRLAPVHRGDTAHAGRAWPGPGPSSGVMVPEVVPEGSRSVRVVAGPHAGRHGVEALRALLETTWEVSPRSDRTGIRLSGPAPLPHGTPELVSMGMAWGAVQAPPGGAPIVLLADAPTVGGYPVLGVVVTADLPILGQLRAGDGLRFLRVDPGAARRLLLAEEESLAAAAAALGGSAARRPPMVPAIEPGP